MPLVGDALPRDPASRCGRDALLRDLGLQGPMKVKEPERRPKTEIPGGNDHRAFSDTYAPLPGRQGRSQTSRAPTRLFGPLFDITDDVADRLQLFGIFIRNFDRKLLLEGHHEFDRIKRVSAEILNEGSVRGNLLRIDPKLFDDDLLHLFFDGFL